MSFCTRRFRIFPRTDQGLTTWNFNFPYIKPGDVKCSVSLPDGSEYLIPRTVIGTTATLTTPPVGALLTIFRDSDVTLPAVVFSDDEPIRIEDVALHFTQLRYLAEELADYIGVSPEQSVIPVG